ncbi:MAG: hypothetical protein ACI360_08615 [Atopobiaceae bacterium]
MLHSKLPGLMGDVERLARVAAGAGRQQRAASTRLSASASYDNGDGTKTVIGAQTGGVTIATHVGDLVPPGKPTGIAGASSSGVVYVAWDGTLDGGIPSDFCMVSCYMTVSGVDQLVGTLTEAGIVSTVPMQTTASVTVWATAEDDACLADGTPAHNVSEKSDAATVTVTQAADPAAVTALTDTVKGLSVKVDTASDQAQRAYDETKDLVTLRIDSSRGTVFKNNRISTVLTVRCYKRGTEITTQAALRDAMGDTTARIRWWVLREGDSDWVSLSSSDPMLSQDGFALAITPDDVEVKCTFKAEVVTS